jgi:hypothetical protein
MWLKKREDICKAIEATEIAKQREMEARKAKEEAERLNQKIEPEKN